MKTSFVFLILLITTSIIAQTYQNNHSIILNNVEYYVATDRSTYSQGDTIYMIYRQTNLGSYPITLHFPSSQVFDFWTQNWIWSHRMAFLAIFLTPVLNTGQSIQGEFAWDMQDTTGNLLSPGNYDIFGELACWENVPLSVPVTINAPSIFPSVSDESQLANYILYQNYPNPFNMNTEFKLQLSNKAQVKLKIFDSRGRLILILFKGILSSGNHSFIWNGKNSHGNYLSTGVYFCLLDIDGKISDTKKILLFK